MRVQPPQLTAVDDWISTLPDPKPSRPEAIRRIVDYWFLTRANEALKHRDTPEGFTGLMTKLLKDPEIRRSFGVDDEMLAGQNSATDIALYEGPARSRRPSQINVQAPAKALMSALEGIETPQAQRIRAMIEPLSR